MNAMTLTYNNSNFERVDKRVAEKFFKAGKRVCMLPCYANPNSPWNVPYLMDYHAPFIHQINEFTYYNCNKEMGTYPSFYVEKEC